MQTTHTGNETVNYRVIYSGDVITSSIYCDRTGALFDIEAPIIIGYVSASSIEEAKQKQLRDLRLCENTENQAYRILDGCSFEVYKTPS